MIETVNQTATTREEFAAAVAVLVREFEAEVDAFRFPGVLWFNDQYLVNPEGRGPPATGSPRYPCSGAVIAANPGDIELLPSVDIDPANPDNPVSYYIPATATYVESYHITDPNDRSWTVDRWDIGGTPYWSVAIMNNQARYTEPDDGDCIGQSATDSPCGGPVLLPFTDNTPQASGTLGQQDSIYNDTGDREGRTQCQDLAPGGGALTTGDNGYRYICGGQDTPQNCAGTLRYNAVLYFFIDDLLTSAGTVKDHTDGSADRLADVSGCHEPHPNPAFTDNWPCPGDDDAREGNSHAYNPENQWPLQISEGRNNHGGSADCDGDTLGDQYCHATRNVDIHYSWVEAAPLLREFRVMDIEGKTAPYHCHEDMDLCNEGDVPPGVL